MDNMIVTMNKENDSMKVTLSRLPKTLQDLQNLGEEYFKTPEFACAMFVACITNFEDNKEETVKMIDYINGPNEVSPFEQQFLTDRLAGKIYKAFSYFDGSKPSNNYTPNTPYVVYVKSNPYTDSNEGYKRFVMKSSGADNERTITVRLKPSTGCWYLNNEELLSDIRIPDNQNEWI